MKSQIELAKEKGIEVGSRVRYTELYPQYFGEIDGIVSFIHPEKGAFFKDENGYTFIFPVQSLEKVEEDIKLQTLPSWDADRVHISVHMTKREYFAAMAMQGLCANEETKYKQVHTIAISIADALIAELNKGEGV